MKLLKSDEYHADMGARIFVRFSRDESGKILGEPPEVRCCSGCFEDDFDGEQWTHFIDDNLNSMFSDADPANYPIIRRIDISTQVEIMIAKRAMELFDSEYMGQERAPLWQWAESQAKKEIMNHSEIPNSSLDEKI